MSVGGLRIPLFACVLAAAVVVPTQPAFATSQGSSATVDGSTTYQRIAGFGSSEAFLQAKLLMADPSSVQGEVLSLLYSPRSGAGLTILRNQIGSTTGFGTIEPTAPSGPTAAPTYVPLGDDDGQQWLAATIKQEYGVDQFIADSWGAPPFMKTNGSDTHGGMLCGAPGTHCASGDWREAYADYLVQYAQDYAAAGLPLEYVDFENEANLPAAGYTSMIMTPRQTADFAPVLGAALARSRLPTRFQCCNTEGWNYATRYVRALEAYAPAARAVKVFSSHGYTKEPASPLPGWNEPVWETEWSTFDRWDPAWDDGTRASGLSWAENIYKGLAYADLGAFFYWWGTSQYGDDNQSLVRVDGSAVTPSARLWAFANYSRFVRPGAIRIGAATDDRRLDLTAFRNTNGTVAVVALNTDTHPVTVTVSLSGAGLPGTGSATPYLTDASADTAAQPAAKIRGGSFRMTLPKRALVTYVLRA